MGESPAWARALEAHRARRCWSVHTLARKLREEADRVGEGLARDLARMIRYWERGDRRPSELYRRLLSRVYGVNEAELFADAVPLETAEVDEVKRREFLRTAAAAATAATAPTLTPRRVGRSDVADLERAISDVRALDQRLGGEGRACTTSRRYRSDAPVSYSKSARTQMRPDPSCTRPSARRASWLAG